MTRSRYDISIMGAGPAGATAAVVLARAGARVAILQKVWQRPKYSVGETLPSAANPVLGALGLSACVAGGEHLASVGQTARWGSSTLQSNEAILGCYGEGWHLDRPRFDRAMLGAAIGAGATIFPYSGSAEARIGNRHGFLFDANGVEPISLQADVVIDCTGRAACVGIKNGAKRTVIDRLTAMWALLKTDYEDVDAQTYIESQENGWMYTARVPGGRRVVVVFTDGDMLEKYFRGAREDFATELNDWHYFAELCTRVSFRVESGPFRAAAATTRLDIPFGERWVAAGDAAQTYDPLSSQGITSAITGANNAAVCLIKGQAGLTQSLEEYEAALNQSFDSYMKLRSHYYSRERRWRNSPFWLRRSH